MGSSFHPHLDKYVSLPEEVLSCGFGSSRLLLVSQVPHPSTRLHWLVNCTMQQDACAAYTCSMHRHVHAHVQGCLAAAELHSLAGCAHVKWLQDLGHSLEARFDSFFWLPSSTLVSAEVFVLLYCCAVRCHKCR
jgi:hypothetical protein